LLGVFFVPEDGDDIFLRNFYVFSNMFTQLFISPLLELYVPNEYKREDSSILQVLILEMGIPQQEFMNREK
jgi:hypothetical protein